MGFSEKDHGGMKAAAAQLMKNREAVEQLARSSDAQKLMELLKRQGGGVQQAAQAAAAGDPGQLMAIMNQLMNSAEGAELVGRIETRAKEAGLSQER